MKKLQRRQAFLFLVLIVFMGLGLTLGSKGGEVHKNPKWQAKQIGNDEVDTGYLQPMIGELEQFAVTLKGQSEYPLEGVKASTDCQR